MRLLLLGLVTIGLFVGLGTSAVLIAAESPSSKPNVLFIAADDLRVELACYGGTLVKSPNIDRLAEQGTLFRRSYCQQALCNPSRASLLTGLRPDTIRIWNLPTHFREHRPDTVTLPQLFKLNGYHAQGIGKVFHNFRQDAYKGDPASWSVPATLHYANHYSDKPMTDGDLPPNFATLTKTECRDVPDEAYFDGRVAAEAVQALREIKEKPFFLAVGFWKPHLPFNAPKKYWDLYERSRIDLPPNPEPPKGGPEIALTKYEIDDKQKSLTEDEVRELRHGYYAATSYLDAQLGKVLDELDRLGLRERTIIVFWSDHGFHLGERGLWSKTTNFELDARVPLIISAPGHKGGQQADGLVELLDLYPTLADLCGLKTPADLEGVSLRPLLDDPKGSVKSVALTQAPRPNYYTGEEPEVMGYSLRTDRYRYTEWRNFANDKVVARELYDHQSDPRETANVVEDAQFAATVGELATRLSKEFKRR